MQPFWCIFSTSLVLVSGTPRLRLIRPNVHAREEHYSALILSLLN